MSYNKLVQFNNINLSQITETKIFHCGCCCIAENNRFLIGTDEYEDLAVINSNTYSECCCMTGSKTSYIRRSNITNIVSSQGLCNNSCICAKYCGFCRYYDLEVKTQGSESFKFKIQNMNKRTLLSWYLDSEPDKQEMS